MKKDFIKALKNGSEIVVISADKNTNSAVFYMKHGKLYTWSREIGTIERTDRTLEEINTHLNFMLTENAQVIVRGY